jgi:hypothetical protein
VHFGGHHPTDSTIVATPLTPGPCGAQVRHHHVVGRADNARGRPGGPTGPLRTPSRTPRILSR